MVLKSEIILVVSLSLFLVQQTFAIEWLPISKPSDLERVLEQGNMSEEVQYLIQTNCEKNVDIFNILNTTKLTNAEKNAIATVYYNCVEASIESVLREDKFNKMAEENLRLTKELDKKSSYAEILTYVSIGIAIAGVVGGAFLGNYLTTKRKNDE